MTDVISEANAETVAAPAPGDALDEQLVAQLSERARAEGLRLTGQGGLLARLTKMVVESALEGDSFRYASKKDWSAIAKDLKPVYTAASESAALDRFVEFSEKWEKRYPAIIRLWTNAWAEFVPFLQFDREIRTIICTTNAIESINARIRRAVNARGHFPTEQAALKCVYLAVMSLDPTGTGRQRWSNRWKAALNAFEVTFDGRLSAGKK